MQRTCSLVRWTRYVAKLNISKWSLNLNVKEFLSLSADEKLRGFLSVCLCHINCCSPGSGCPYLNFDHLVTQTSCPLRCLTWSDLTPHLRNLYPNPPVEGRRHLNGTEAGKDLPESKGTQNVTWVVDVGHWFDVQCSSLLGKTWDCPHTETGRLDDNQKSSTLDPTRPSHYKHYNNYNLLNVVTNQWRSVCTRRAAFAFRSAHFLFFSDCMFGFFKNPACTKSGDFGGIGL